MALYIGIDTSCYTTSVACVDEKSIVYEKRTVLSVKEGERGLRQSDGVFQHVRNLEPLLTGLFEAVPREDVRAVGVSCAPRDGADSYMPVFTVGKTAASAIASSMGVPLVQTSHQRGHVRAALLGNEALMERHFVGLHISGGTTEIFTVSPSLSITLLGGTNDLHAGQFVDRVGVRLGLSFPTGPHLERLAGEAQNKDVKLPSSVSGMECSFSGVETRAQALAGSVPDAELAYAVYDCLARTIAKLIANAAKAAECHDVLIAGGVASSALLRAMLKRKLTAERLFFAGPMLSSDNAAGVAMIARDNIIQGETDGRNN